MRLGYSQLRFDFFQSFLFCLQSGFGLGHFLRSGIQFLQTALVRSGNLLHHINAIQKVGEAVCLEQHRPVGNLAFLLHCLNPLFILFGQVIEFGFRVHQLLLLVRNQQAVCRNLAVDVALLLVQQENLLVDQIFLSDHLLYFIVILRDLALNLLNLGIYLRFLRLQGIQLRLQFTG